MRERGQIRLRQGGGGGMFRERQGVKKKIRGRQAGGLGSEPVHVYVREEERKLQANVRCVCLCVCARVCSRSVPFLSLFDYRVGKKARQNIER